MAFELSRGIMAVLLGATAAGVVCPARAQTGEVRQILQATNTDRARHGLAPLRWDGALARAAQAHAYEMLRHGQLAHQYAGEPELSARAGHDGAHFSTIAENVAVAGDPFAVEDEWMHSPPHRRNILDPRLTAIGVGVVRQGSRLWAVEDMSAAVAQMSASGVEEQVGRLLAARGLRVLTSSASARKTCSMDHGFAGARPDFVMRWEGSAVDRLPGVLEQKLQTGRFHEAAVGSCRSSSDSPGFTAYRLAVLLY